MHQRRYRESQIRGQAFPYQVVTDPTLSAVLDKVQQEKFQGGTYVLVPKGWEEGFKEAPKEKEEIYEAEFEEPGKEASRKNRMTKIFALSTKVGD